MLADSTTPLSAPKHVSSYPSLFAVEPRRFHIMASPSSLPSPPFVHVEGIANFRDIGDDVHVRRGLVFRSADPSKATPGGLRTMGEELG